MDSLIAGGDITDYLVKLLNQRGYAINTAAEREMVDGPSSQPSPCLLSRA
jgi:hypothetical protein